MTRAAWKVYYRLLRIARHEAYKASIDVMLYGTGFVLISPDLPDLCRHVPLEEIEWPISI